jgi:hypothetical protein
MTPTASPPTCGVRAPNRRSVRLESVAGRPRTFRPLPTLPSPGVPIRDGYPGTRDIAVGVAR